jgi:hypothetical protein
MIKFDKTKLTTQIVLLKSVTQALGGAISVIDEEKSIDRKEVTIRIPVPLSVARAFIIRHKKVTKYLKPVLTALVMYEGRVISMERHAMGSMGELMHEGFGGEMVMWEPYSVSNLNQLIYPLMAASNKDWYIDGRYVYSFESFNLDRLVDEAPTMTADAHFRKLSVTAIDFQEISNADKLQPTNRSCLVYKATTGEFIISPPIWKELGGVGASKRSEDDAAAPVASFDEIDENMCVNLNFALTAGKQIGAMFGYEEVEPLQLPRLMIELHTVNLPNIPSQVKSTYDIGMSFTHTLAWLMGLSRQADTLDAYIMIRSLLKYLTTKGIYRSNLFQVEQVFVEGTTLSTLKMKSLDDLMADPDITGSAIRSILNKTKKSSTQQVNVVAGLLTEKDI